jgi:hypothetical protein
MSERVVPMSRRIAHTLAIMLPAAFAIVIPSAPLAGCGGGTTLEGQSPCTAGRSVSCVGPGGCAGGQTCNRDGQGYGACVCGVTGSDAAPDVSDGGPGHSDSGLDTSAPDSSFDASHDADDGAQRPDGPSDAGADGVAKDAAVDTGTDTSMGSCSSVCTSNSFCQSVCGTTETYCCDLPTGACYATSLSKCPF